MINETSSVNRENLCGASCWLLRAASLLLTKKNNTWHLPRAHFSEGELHIPGQLETSPWLFGALFWLESPETSKLMARERSIAERCLGPTGAKA